MKPALRLIGILGASLALFLSACAGGKPAEEGTAAPAGLAVATFAGGCFWCVEADFEKVPGVVEAVSGYTGGRVPNPSYRQVSSGSTGHREAVQVSYDPAKISYDGLLQSFWRMVDPTDAGGQFSDRGKEYTTAIWYHDQQQRDAALASKAALAASGRYPMPIVTPILPATRFYAAEADHQDYYRRNPVRYRYYRYFSGRDQYLERTWGAALNLDYGSFGAKAD
jgi:peptide methionine sulfoxide reductase msrA/msrB